MQPQYDDTCFFGEGRRWHANWIDGPRHAVLIAFFECQDQKRCKSEHLVPFFATGKVLPRAALPSSEYEMDSVRCKALTVTVAKGMGADCIWNHRLAVCPAQVQRPRCFV